MHTLISDIDFSKHALGLLRAEVCDIARPLKILSVEYFSYSKIYFDDASRFFLSTHPEFFEFYRDEKLYMTNSFHSLYPDNGYYFADVNSTQHDDIIPMIKYANEYLDIGCLFTIVKRFDTYFEGYVFGFSSRSNYQLHHCMNNAHLLEKYIAYFKERAGHLIREAEVDNRMIYPIQDITGHNFYTQDSRQVNEFLSNIIVAGCVLPSTQGDVHVTKREADCLFYLLQGLSSKAIGRELNISYRTVEAHSNSLKSKFHCYSKSQLLKIANEYRYLESLQNPAIRDKKILNH